MSEPLDPVFIVGRAMDHAKAFDHPYNAPHRVLSALAAAGVEFSIPCPNGCKDKWRFDVDRALCPLCGGLARVSWSPSPQEDAK